MTVAGLMNIHKIEKTSYKKIMCFNGWTYSISLSLILLFAQNNHLCLSASAKNYVARPGTRLIQSSIAGSSNASSKLECVSSCQSWSTPGCETASWSESLRQCLLSEFDTATWWPADHADHAFLEEDPKWVTYGEIVYPVAQFEGPGGRYSLTFAQAREVCLAHDTVLATSAQVLTARAMGMSLCGCGWLAGGGNGFVLHGQDIFCWNTYSTGIIYCGFTFANVWCVMQ